VKEFPVFLIIDDDPDDVSIFCEAVGEVYPESICMTADNGSDGLAMLRESDSKTPHIIFLDLNMPKMDGKGCCDGLKRIRTFKLSRL
jgi:CheY-like chemotaxis protein